MVCLIFFVLYILRKNSFERFKVVLFNVCTAVAQWLRCCTANQKVTGSIPAGVRGFLFDIKSFRSHYGPGVDSASNRNEYQEYLLGGKGGRCVRLTTYHHPVPLSRNLGTLNSWKAQGLSRPVMGLLYCLMSLVRTRVLRRPVIRYAYASGVQHVADLLRAVCMALDKIMCSRNNTR